MWTNFIVFNFWTIFFVFFNSSWSNLLQILLGWIRIRIYKAAGSGSALRWTVGSGSAKNECGSTALNTTMNLTHKKWKYSVALTDNQSGTTFNTTVLYFTRNYGSVTSRDVKLFRQVLLSFSFVWCWWVSHSQSFYADPDLALDLNTESVYFSMVPEFLWTEWNH